MIPPNICCLFLLRKNEFQAHLHQVLLLSVSRSVYLAAICINHKHGQSAYQYSLGYVCNMSRIKTKRPKQDSPNRGPSNG
jgi:hypothetical protein